MLNWKDIAKYIEKKNNVTLTPTQKEILKAIIRGETISTPRGCGRTMLYEGYGSYLVEIESKKESPQLRELMTEPDEFDQTFSIHHMLDQDYFMGNTMEYQRNHNLDDHYQKFEDFCINIEQYSELKEEKKELDIFFNTGWMPVVKVPESIFDYGKVDIIGIIDVSTGSCSNSLILYREEVHKSLALVNFLTDEMALFKTYSDLWNFCTREHIPLNKLKEEKGENNERKRPCRLHKI